MANQHPYWWGNENPLRIRGGRIQRKIRTWLLYFILNRKEKKANIKHPCKVIWDEILKPRNISLVKFSEMMGEDASFGEEFVSGMPINYELDKKLSKVLGTPKGHFPKLYDEWKEKTDDYLALAFYLAWNHGKKTFRFFS